MSAAALYVNYYSVLANIALQRFRLPNDEAENAIHEVFVAYLRTTALIRNPKAWLIAALFNSCRTYWRRSGPGGDKESGRSHEPDVDGPILSRQLLEQLPLATRQALRLHYIEGLTAPEIAAQLRTSPRYAEVLIRRGLSRARWLLRR